MANTISINDLKFDWIPFYEELADKLLKYKNNRKQLLEIIKKCYDDMPIKYPFLEKGKVNYSDVDPFTVFGTFNRGLKDQTRIDILKHYKDAFGVKADVPNSFEGIPVLMNMSAWFFAYKEHRGENDIDNLWELFEAALNYADHEADIDKFMFFYDQVLTQRQVKWNITMGLFWIRPKTFISLDSVNREYIKKYSESTLPPVTILISEVIAKSEKTGNVVPAKDYFELNRELSKAFKHHSYKGVSNGVDTVDSIPLLSYDAWLLSQEKNVIPNDDWIGTDYDLDLSIEDWKELLNNSEVFDNNSLLVMACFKDFGGVATCKQLSLKYGRNYNFYNIVSTSLAKRIVNCIGAKEDIREDGTTRWWSVLYLGKWASETEEGQFLWKLRDNLSKALDFVDLSNIEIYEKKKEAVSYNKVDFLNDVFMTSDEYDELVGLLEHKKNLILQGAPGVGKSYAAKRLAYSIIGSIDDEKVQMVQFHQSYSYEDFIAGFRPNDNGGFYIQDGPFYTFCKTAEDDFDNKYFFIIDEINRGNLSKIFGELMLLLEGDKRGNENNINLLYKNEPFSVPENVYIIGMMNTADRSLAMIDYALRRRFVFYTMEPAFEKDSFKAFTANYSANNFDKVINVIIALNADIASDVALGKGFRIGHSYFCSNDIDDNKLAGIVKYEIIPQLYEYWFDDEAKAKDWESRLLGAIND